MEYNELVARVAELESKVIMMAGSLSIFSGDTQANHQAIIGILEGIASQEDISGHVIKNLEIGTSINLAGLTNEIAFDRYEKASDIMKDALNVPVNSEISINLQ